MHLPGQRSISLLLDDKPPRTSVFCLLIFALTHAYVCHSCRYGHSDTDFIRPDGSQTAHRTVPSHLNAFGNPEQTAKFVASRCVDFGKDGRQSAESHFSIRQTKRSEE